MNDLVTWLRAQLDEDVRRAQRVRQAYADEEKFWAPAVVINAGALVDPARVLRDVAAKRAIVEALAPDLRAASGLVPVDTFAEGLERELRAMVLLRHLAAAYEDRPGYQESWRP